MRVEGHLVCAAQRRHDISHWDCCFGANEFLSWVCDCPCHAKGKFRGSTMEDALALAAREDFKARMKLVLERRQMALGRVHAPGSG